MKDLFGIVLALFVVLFILSLGLAAFHFLTDRISVFSIWQSPFWLKWKTPIIVIGAIGSLILFVAWLRAMDIRRLEAMQAYARENDWAFSRKDDEGLKERIEQVFYDRFFKPSRIRTVETGDRTVSLFDCLHKHRKAMANVRDNLGTGCLIESTRFNSIMDPLIVSEYLVINETLIGQEVRFDESAFSRRFVVRSTAPASARLALSPAIQSIILEYKLKNPDLALQVALAPAGAVALTEETTDPTCWQQLIQLARDIEAALP